MPAARHAREPVLCVDGVAGPASGGGIAGIGGSILGCESPCSTAHPCCATLINNGRNEQYCIDPYSYVTLPSLSVKLFLNTVNQTNCNDIVILCRKYIPRCALKYILQSFITRFKQYLMIYFSFWLFLYIGKLLLGYFFTLIRNSIFLYPIVYYLCFYNNKINK